MELFHKLLVEAYSSLDYEWSDKIRKNNQEKRHISNYA